MGLKNWAGFQGKEPEITPLAKGWFSFRCECKKDAYYVLGKIWNYGTTPFQLKRWTPLFDADTERLDTIPVWVRLLGLPWEFWNPASLDDIGRALGSFIEENLSCQKTRVWKVARILVTLNIGTSLLDHINLICETKTRKQLLDYEGIPFRYHKWHEM